MKIKLARAVRSFTITSQDWNALTTEKFVSYEFSYLWYTSFDHELPQYSCIQRNLTETSDNKL